MKSVLIDLDEKELRATYSALLESIGRARISVLSGELNKEDHDRSIFLIRHGTDAAYTILMILMGLDN